MIANSLIAPGASRPPVRSPLMAAVVAASIRLPRGHGTLPRLLGPLILRGRDYATTTPRGFRMVWHPSNVEVVAYMRRAGGWDEEVAGAIARHAPAAGVIYDVGANSGYMTMVAAQAAPSARVIAFEPLPALARTLRAAADLNGFAHVEVYAAALSDRDGSVGLFVPPRTVHASFAGRAGSARIDVPTLALDRAVAAGELPPPDLIKVDVEGAELLVIAGAAETLRAHRPTLIYECDENADRFGHAPGAVIARLRGLGYTRFTLLGKSGAADRPASEADAPYGDYLAER